jgi:DNA-binding NarL/FixJ family response regulator
MPCEAAVQDCRMSEQAGETRVLVVDDDPFTLTVLRGVVDVPPFSVVGVSGTFAEGLSVARQERPAVLLVDLDLGEGPTGIDLAHAVRRSLPSVGIVVLSTYIDPRLIGANVDLPPGSIYLTKQEVEELGILHGALVAAARMPLGEHQNLAGDERLQNLTDGQVEVMRLIAAGFSNSEIARRLVIEEASVEKAVMRLIRQLGVKATRQENQRVMIAQAYFALSGTRSVHRS